MVGNRRNIPSHIYRALLARSGNKCAYPNCTHPIINSDNVLVGQLCHIESVSENGERFNSTLTEDEINSYDNLMFLCLKHHIETDNVEVYSVSVLKKMKYEHESKYVENPFNIDMSHIFKIKMEIDEFWRNVEVANEKEHIYPYLKIPINTKADYDNLNIEILNIIKSLENLINIFDEEIKDKYWVVFNIGFPNHLMKIKILLEHMSIKYLEEYVISNSQDLSAKQKLAELRKSFLDISKSAISHD